MSSVQDHVECPQCGNKNAFYELNCNSLAESLHCFRCGYYCQGQPLIDRKKQKKDPKHEEWYKLDRKGKRIFRTYERKGYGAYYLAGTKGGTAGGLHRPITEKEIEKFIATLSRSNIDPQRCYLTRWNPDTKEIEYIVGRESLLV